MIHVRSTRDHQLRDPDLIVQHGSAQQSDEQDLDGAQIGPGFEQVRGEGVSQRVRMNCLRDPGGACGVAARQLDRLGADGPAAVPRRKQPVSGALDSPISAQQFQQLLGQQGLPILTPFALAHP